jgi:hypothetical protein
MSRVIEKEKKLSELNYAFTVEGFQIALQLTFWGLAKLGHLKYVSLDFAQMPNRITNVEFITSAPIFMHSSC